MVLDRDVIYPSVCFATGEPLPNGHADSDSVEYSALWKDIGSLFQAYLPDEIVSVTVPESREYLAKRTAAEDKAFLILVGTCFVLGPLSLIGERYFPDVIFTPFVVYPFFIFVVVVLINFFFIPSLRFRSLKCVKKKKFSNGICLYWIDYVHPKSLKTLPEWDREYLDYLRHFDFAFPRDPEHDHYPQLSACLSDDEK